jgi:hypothetical protein
MNIAKKVLNNMLGTKKKAKDSDYDGVPDYKDCQPHNTMRQDFITDEGRKRLSQMNKRSDEIMKI